MKIWSEPHGDMGTNSSEIPCRVIELPVSEGDLTYQTHS